MRWVVPLKDKKGITENVFQIFLDEFGRKPNKIWLDQGSEFYNRLMNLACKIMIMKFVQHAMKKNWWLQKDLSEF